MKKEEQKLLGDLLCDLFDARFEYEAAKQARVDMKHFNCEATKRMAKRLSKKENVKYLIRINTYLNNRSKTK